MGAYGSPELNQKEKLKKGMMYCKTCGKEIAKNAEMCPNCGAKIKILIYKKWWFWIIIILIIASANSSSNTNNLNSKSGESIETNSTKTQPQFSEEDYKAICDSYNYKDIARNPNTYKDKYMQFTGKVVQTSELYGTVTLRINVTKNEYDFWEDTIYATYKYFDENESKILEDDIITVYGICKGNKTYTSILGSSVTIPSIEVKYWDLKS